MTRTHGLGLIAVALMACQAEVVAPLEDAPIDDARGLACDAFALDYDATYHLGLPPGARVVDAAIGGGTIGVIAVARDGRPALHRFDTQTKDHLGAQHVDVAGCTLTSLTRSPGAWLGAYACRDTIDVRDLERDTSVARFAAPTGSVRGAPRFIAYDAARAGLWLHDGGLFRVALEATASIEVIGHTPRAWGRASGFEHTGDKLLFVRAAPRGGAPGQLSVEDEATGERCIFDVGATPGLERQGAIRTFALGDRVFLLTQQGMLAELLLTDLR